MKKFILFVIAAFSLSSASAQLSFKISKPLCVLTFLETAAGSPRMSKTFHDHITRHISPADSAAFYALIKRFNAINMDHSYVPGEYPEARQKPRSSANLIKMAAVQAIDNEDFFQRITGILPYEQWLALKDVMRQITPYYDKLVWNAEKEALEKQLKNLTKYTNNREAFIKLKTFYGSSWSDDMPFTVAIYPIPGSKGNTRASPHNNSLVLAVLTGHDQAEEELSIVFHEIGHVFYEEQPLALQQELDEVFATSKSLYAEYAYSYLDEALATASGNGWTYEYLSGHVNTGSWYDNDYINRYAHAIYPMVRDYINSGKTIDAAFITNAIEAFEKEFPDAAYSYDNLLNKVNFYTDASGHEQYERITNVLSHHFRVYSFNASYPITDPQALDMAASEKGTQMFIIHKDHHKNMNALKAIFPELKNISAEQEALVSFIDKDKRPVIVLTVKNEDRIDGGLKKMESWKKIDIKQPVRLIE